MNKVNLKKFLILNLAALSFNSNAYSLGDNDVMAKQCQELSEAVASLISSQAKNTCAEKLGMASIQIEKAGNLILDSAYNTAKVALNNAIFTLQYAELNTCNRYIEISHSKLEAQKIKNLL
jgi:hypothetical protein